MVKKAIEIELSQVIEAQKREISSLRLNLGRKVNKIQELERNLKQRNETIIFKNERINLLEIAIEKRIC